MAVEYMPRLLEWVLVSTLVILYSLQGWYFIPARNKCHRVIVQLVVIQK
jgi:hypothetical protein